MRKNRYPGQDFKDNEVTLSGRKTHPYPVSDCLRLSENYILIELAVMDNQYRLSQEQLQHTQHIAARDLVRSLNFWDQNPLSSLRDGVQLLAKALSDPVLIEYTKVFIEQADRLRKIVEHLLGP